MDKRRWKKHPRPSQAGRLARNIMKKTLKRIVIVTRPKEQFGYYEYFIDVRKKRFLFFPSNELEYFEKALLNISLGKNPSGWMLTKPSEKDKGIEIQPMSDNYFYTWDDEIYFFPNNSIRDEWLNYHWKKYRLEDDKEIFDIHGLNVRRITGEAYSD